MTPEEPSELTVRPGDQAGWTISPEGELRCQTLGHDVDSVLAMPNGLFVGYCVRCSARFELAWFRGGTAAALAETMANEALSLKRPAASVLDDLDQVAGLLAEDADAIARAARLLSAAQSVVATHLNRGN